MKKLLVLVIMCIIFTAPAYGQERIASKSETQKRADLFDGVFENVNETIQMLVKNNTKPQTKYSTSNHLNIRKEPNTESDIIGRLSLNSSVQVLAEYQGWCCINTEAGVAYVSSEYLSTEKTTMIPLGNFKITYYCCQPYRHICGGGRGITAMGTRVRPGVVSVDPNVIPLGSKVMINGQIYSAEDTGSAIKGNKIDMAVDTHKHALELGIRREDVYLMTE